MKVGDVVRVIDETSGRPTAQPAPILRGMMAKVVDVQFMKSQGKDFLLIDFGQEVFVEGRNILHDGMDDMADREETHWWIAHDSVELLDEPFVLIPQPKPEPYKFQYEVGDKVVVRKDLECSRSMRYPMKDSIHDNDVCPPMLAQAKLPYVTIAEHIEGQYEIEEDDGRFWWTDGMFEGRYLEA